MRACSRRGPAVLAAPQAKRSQYVYFCTSKVCVPGGDIARQYLYFGTSKAVSICTLVPGKQASWVRARTHLGTSTSKTAEQALQQSCNRAVLVLVRRRSRLVRRRNRRKSTSTSTSNTAEQALQQSCNRAATELQQSWVRAPSTSSGRGKAKAV